MKIEYSKEVLERAKKAVEIGQAVLDGKEIEYRDADSTENWDEARNPTLNFFTFNYRVKPKDPYLRLDELTEELWRTKKSIQWAHEHEKFELFAKIDKIINEIRTLDFEKENNILKEIYLPNKTQ